MLVLKISHIGHWYFIFMYLALLLTLYLNGLVQGCSNSIANALELLACCTEPLIWESTNVVSYKQCMKKDEESDPDSKDHVVRGGWGVGGGGWGGGGGGGGGWGGVGGGGWGVGGGKHASVYIMFIGFAQWSWGRGFLDHDLWRHYPTYLEERAFEEWNSLGFSEQRVAKKRNAIGGDL